MESFFQRMSSIVLQNKDKEDEDLDENETFRQQHFRHLQERRRSAPDIRRRGVVSERLGRVLDQKGTSEEQIPTQFSSAPVRWRRYVNANGK